MINLIQNDLSVNRKETTKTHNCRVSETKTGLYSNGAKRVTDGVSGY